MPKIKGSKAYAISGLLRDLPDNQSDESGVFCGIPNEGISDPEDIHDDELLPHYFVPDFIRPVPEAEEDPEIVDDELREYDISSDAIHLVPGVLPEPYWDFNMV